MAVCCESALRQAEKSESSGENAVESCDNTSVRISGKETMDPGGLGTTKRPTINTNNLKKELKIIRKKKEMLSALPQKKTILKYLNSTTQLYVSLMILENRYIPLFNTGKYSSYSGTTANSWPGAQSMLIHRKNKTSLWEEEGQLLISIPHRIKVYSVL